MRPNRIRQLWAEGKPAINGWCAIPSAFSAEVMAHMGWDSVTVDMQHGVVDYQTCITMFQAISTTDAMPMARVPWNEPAYIMKALDGGAYGIICPMVNNRAEAEKFAGAMRYTPDGYRSSGPIRAAFYGGADYNQKANETVLGFAMIETQEAIANIDAICSTPGIDAIYIGPSDLSISFGGSPGLDQTNPVVVEAIGKALAGAKKHGLRAGIQCTATDYAKKMIAQGFDLVTVMSDQRLMTALGTKTVAEMREGAAPKASGSVY